jgi:hypothetical protein
MEYIYIVQASQEPSWCKIGKTNNLDKRLGDYNNMTGKSKENTYQYLFVGQVLNMAIVENDIKEKYSYLREIRSREIYLYNKEVFKFYVDYIKNHPLFVKEIVVKVIEKEVHIVKKTTPSL